MDKNKQILENQIIDKIIEDIKNGLFDKSNILPSENALAKQYCLSRHRIRYVYERLEAMGYIDTKPGIGRFVRLQKNKIEIPLSGNKSFSEKIVELGHQLESQLIDCSYVNDNIKFFEDKLEANDRIIRFCRLRVINGEPVAIHTSFVLESQFPHLMDASKNIQSLFKYYRTKGLREFYYEDSVLSTFLPSYQEKQLLECPSLVPIMLLESTCYDRQSGKLVELTRIIYRSDRFVCKLYSPNH